MSLQSHTQRRERVALEPLCWLQTTRGSPYTGLILPGPSMLALWPDSDNAKRPHHIKWFGPNVKKPAWNVSLCIYTDVPWTSSWATQYRLMASIDVRNGIQQQPLTHIDGSAQRVILLERSQGLGLILLIIRTFISLWIVRTQESKACCHFGDPYPFLN